MRRKYDIDSIRDGMEISECEFLTIQQKEEIEKLKTTKRIGQWYRKNKKSLNPMQVAEICAVMLRKIYSEMKEN